VATAEFIPKMASQVILMVSKEQGSENVIEKLKDRIGEEYCLVSHSSGSQGEKSAESISIGGKEIPISVFDSSFEGTEIKRVE
jgi:hypothetical protein